MGRYLRNILRAWKVVSFLAGTAFFVWGAKYWGLRTWDVGVSILMSVLCYLLAPLATSLIICGVCERKRGWGLRVFVGVLLIYVVASGSYEIYNTIRLGMHPPTYWENLLFSVPTTIIAGLIWRFDGSFVDLLQKTKNAFSREGSAPAGR